MPQYVDYFVDFVAVVDYVAPRWMKMNNTRHYRGKELHEYKTKFSE
jgi:hypothetical protein